MDSEKGRSAELRKTFTDEVLNSMGATAVGTLRSYKTCPVFQLLGGNGMFDPVPKIINLFL